MKKTLDVSSREDWREWLERHHAKETEIWLIYYKKHTGKPRIPYDDAVEEALCFGWIDSIVKRIDDERFMQKFTPRRGKSVWSAHNKKRALKMIRCGKMTEAGLALVNDAKKSGAWKGAPNRPTAEVMPKDLKNALTENKRARESWQALAPSRRKLFIGWIEDAKRDDTRSRRISKTIEQILANKKGIL